jgi:hypothetical protein
MRISKRWAELKPHLAEDPSIGIRRALAILRRPRAVGQDGNGAAANGASADGAPDGRIPGTWPHADRAFNGTGQGGNRPTPQPTECRTLPPPDRRQDPPRPEPHPRPETRTYDFTEEQAARLDEELPALIRRWDMPELGDVIAEAVHLAFVAGGLGR